MGGFRGCVVRIRARPADGAGSAVGAECEYRHVSRARQAGRNGVSTDHVGRDSRRGSYRWGPDTGPPVGPPVARATVVRSRFVASGEPLNANFRLACGRTAALIRTTGSAEAETPASSERGSCPRHRLVAPERPECGSGRSPGNAAALFPRRRGTRPATRSQPASGGQRRPFQRGRWLCRSPAVRRRWSERRLCLRRCSPSRRPLRAGSAASTPSEAAAAGGASPAHRCTRLPDRAGLPRPARVTASRRRAP